MQQAVEVDVVEEVIPFIDRVAQVAAEVDNAWPGWYLDVYVGRGPYLAQEG